MSASGLRRCLARGRRWRRGAGSTVSVGCRPGPLVSCADLAQTPASSNARWQMVLIPYAMRYTATMRGRVPILVQCEKCAFEYVYILEATERGEGTSILFAD